MFNRRHREVAQTSIILILIVALGYGFYLYNLLQAKLEHLDLKSQRYQSQHQALSSQLQTVYEERSRLENSYQKEKLEHQNSKDQLEKVKAQHETDLQDLQSTHQKKYDELDAQHKQVMNELLEAQQTIKNERADKATMEESHKQRIDTLNEVIGKKSSSEQELLGLKMDMQKLLSDHRQAQEQNINLQRSYEDSQNEVNQYHKLKSILKDIGADALHLGHPKLNNLNVENRQVLFAHFGGDDAAIQMERLQQQVQQEQQQRLQAIQQQQEEKMKRDRALTARQVDLSKTSADIPVADHFVDGQEKIQSLDNGKLTSDNENQKVEEVQEPADADVIQNGGSQTGPQENIADVDNVPKQSNLGYHPDTLDRSKERENPRNVDVNASVASKRKLESNQIGVLNDRNNVINEVDSLQQVESQAKAEEGLARLELQRQSEVNKDVNDKLERLKQLQQVQRDSFVVQGQQIDELVKRKQETSKEEDINIRGKIFEEEDAHLNGEIDANDEQDDETYKEGDSQVIVPPAAKVVPHEPEMVVNAPQANRFPVNQNGNNRDEDEYDNYNEDDDREEVFNDKDTPDKEHDSDEMVDNQENYDPDNDEEQQGVDERHQAALEDAEKHAVRRREM